MSDHPAEPKEAGAAQTIELLNAQADALRAELARLQEELAASQEGFSGTHTAQILEANEHLVLAALHAEAIAETALNNLGELEFSSQRDPLTKTPNRAVMLDRLESAIALARRHGTPIALLFVDLDRFKEINDTLGHAAGDQVIQLVAHRLEGVVRDTDTVSRHGGDEFLVLLSEVSQASDVAMIATKVVADIAAPCRIGNQMLQLSASLGVAVYPEDGQDAATLINHADAAMYRAKRRGGNCFEFYGHGPATTPAMAPPAPASATLDLLEREARAGNLREANERLVIAALTAQERESDAEEAHLQQIKFMAIVAHELRNPLAPIRTAAELLKRAAGEQQLLAQTQGVIERQVAHMSRLIQDLLDGSRLSAGKIRLEYNTLDLADLLHQAVETGRPAIEERQQNIVLRLPQHPVWMRGDSVRLTQIFCNLLDNASKYSPNDSEITVNLDERDQANAITVADSGIGISAEALPHIFDLFVQDAHALAFHKGGLGIGLSVVRELVEAHAGSVVARSAGKGLGSTFTVTLPTNLANDKT